MLLDGGEGGDGVGERWGWGGEMGVGTEWLAGYGDWDGVGGRQ